MAIDYKALAAELTAIRDAMKPVEMTVNGDNLRSFYSARVDHYLKTIKDGPEETDKVYHKATYLASFAASGGAGLMVLGPVALAGSAAVALPVGAAIAVGGAALAAARIITRTMEVRKARDDFERSLSLLDKPAAEVVAAYVEDRKGGFFDRLYNRVHDVVSGHEKRAEKLVRQIDALSVPYQAHHGAVTRILKQELSPEFIDFVKRRSTDPSSSASYLMERIGYYTDNLSDNSVNRMRETAYASPMSILSKPSPTGLYSLRASSNPTLQFGTITAPREEESFIRAMGVEVGSYDEGAGQFIVKVDPVVASSKKVESLFDVKLHKVSLALINAETGLATVPLSTLSKDELAGYSASLRFNISKETDLSKSASLQSGMTSVATDSRRRLEEARKAVTSDPGLSGTASLGMS